MGMVNTSRNISEVSSDLTQYEFVLCSKQFQKFLWIILLSFFLWYFINNDKFFKISEKGIIVHKDLLDSCTFTPAPSYLVKFKKKYYDLLHWTGYKFHSGSVIEYAYGK